jgi:hypothetical protein
MGVILFYFIFLSLPFSNAKNDKLYRFFKENKDKYWKANKSTYEISDEIKFLL